MGWTGDSSEGGKRGGSSLLVYTLSLKVQEINLLSVESIVIYICMIDIISAFFF